MRGQRPEGGAASRHFSYRAKLVDLLSLRLLFGDLLFFIVFYMCLPLGSLFFWTMYS